MFESFDQKFKSLQELEDWQKNKLLEFINYALTNSKFYRNKNYPEQIKDIGDFKKLPYFSSEEFRASNLEFLIQPFNLWRVFATSGTTGMPKLSFYGKDLIKSYVIGVGDMLKRAGVELENHDNVGCVMFPMGGLTGSGPATARALEGLNIPTLTFGIDTDPKFGLSIMEKIRPNFIFMYPSAFNVFSNEIEKSGYDIKKLEIQAIFSSGEPLSYRMRSYVEEKWGARVFNVIGSVDIANFTGSECVENDGFHIFPYNTYFEIINEKGESMEEGVGELVLTSLINETMPFVRYKTKDIFEYSKKPCSCGLIAPRMWFKGRKDDLIILTGAAKIFPNDIQQVINLFPDLTSDYKIEIRTVEGKDEITFTFESRNTLQELNKKVVESLIDISSLHRKIYNSKTALIPIVKLVPVNTLERHRGKLKNKLVDLRNKK